MWRFFALLGAFLCLSTPTLAVTPAQQMLIVRNPQGSSSGPPFTPPAVLPAPSAFAAYDNYWVTGNTTVNNGGTFPCPTTCALGVPSTVRNSWVLWVKFRYEDDAAARTQNSKPFTILGQCASACGASGSNRFLQVASPTNTTLAGEILLSAQISNSANLWNPPGSVPTGAVPHTGLTAKPGQDYCLALSQYGIDSAAPGDFSVSLIDAASPANVQNITSTTTNQSSAAAGIYYSAAATLRTQAAIANIIQNLATDNNSAGYQEGHGGPYSQVAMFWGVMPNNGSGVPTTATLQAMCNPANDLKTQAIAAGLTVQSLYNANTSGGFTADSGGTITAGLTTIGSGFSLAGPIMPPPCLQISEPPPGDVFRVEPGMWGVGATGTIYVTGTWNSAACGGTISAIQMRVMSGGSQVLPWKTIINHPSTSFFGGYSGVTAGSTLYTYEVRPANAPAFIYKATNGAYVGGVIDAIGQSQMCIASLASSAVPGGSGGDLTYTGSQPSMINMLAMSDGTSTTNTALAHVYLRQTSALTQPGSVTAAEFQVGNGIMQLLQDLEAASGWPWSYRQYCKSGHPADAWADDYLPASQALTNSAGNTWNGPDGSNTLKNPTITGAPGTLIANVARSMLKGSLTITNGSGTQIGHDDGAGNVVGDNGAVVNSSAVTYEQTAGTALTVTYSATQTGPITAHWTNVEDTLAGAYTPHSTYNTNGLYGVWGDSIHPSSGMVTNVASRVSGPPDMLLEEQCTASAGEVSSAYGSNTAGMASLTLKWDYNNAKFANFKWWKSYPILLLDYPRDGNDGTASIAGCRQFKQHYAGLDGTSGRGNIYWGTGYYDYSVQATNNTPSPHEDSTIFGGRRMGQRLAVVAAKVQQAIHVTDPTITGCAFKTPGPDYTKIVCTVNLPQGTSIATCGPTLAGTNCVFTTANGTSVKGVRIGCCNATASSATYSDYDGLDNNPGFSQYHPASANAGFTCTITSATTFECDKTVTSTPWVTNQTFVQYAADSPYNRQGGIVHYTITTPGTYGANQVNAAAATTGGGCGAGSTQRPTVYLATDSGGHIVTAIPNALGQTCTSAPSVTISGLGTQSVAGTITADAPITTANDNDDMASTLYDNSGGFGSSGSATGSSPGWPVRPVIVPIAVTG